MVFVERLRENGEVGSEFAGARVGRGRLGFPPGELATGQGARRGGQASINADQGAPVGFVAAMLGNVASLFGQRQQGTGGRGQQRAHGELGAQGVRFVEVILENRCALAQ